MFKSLKSLWEKPSEEGVDNNQQACELADKIRLLEAQIADNPRNNEVQKQLMLTYNRALKVYAGSTEYRQHVDNLFERIDELRNVIRRNI